MRFGSKRSGRRVFLHAVGFIRDWFTISTNQTSATVSNNEQHEIIFEANNLSAVLAALAACDLLREKSANNCETHARSPRYYALLCGENLIASFITSFAHPRCSAYMLIYNGQRSTSPCDLYHPIRSIVLSSANGAFVKSFENVRPRLYRLIAIRLSECVQFMHVRSSMEFLTIRVSNNKFVFFSHKLWIRRGEKHK